MCGRRVCCGLRGWRRRSRRRKKLQFVSRLGRGSRLTEPGDTRRRLASPTSTRPTTRPWYARRPRAGVHPEDADVQRIVRHFMRADQPVAQLCHAPQVLAAAGTLHWAPHRRLPGAGPRRGRRGRGVRRRRRRRGRADGLGRAWPDHPSWMREFIGPRGARLGDVVEEAHSRRRRRPAPGEQGRVETVLVRTLGLDGLGDRLEGGFLPPEQPVGSLPTRSMSASLTSRCERTSRTCWTGVSSHCRTASRPCGVTV